VADRPVPGRLSWLKHRWTILLALFAAFTIFYYFGQIVDFFGWTALQWGFFYEVHDTQRLLFLIPIVYACFFFGLKEMLIVTAAAYVVFLPRALLLSPYADPLLRASFFIILAVVLGTLVRLGADYLRRSMDLEVIAGNNGNGAAGEPAGDGVFIIGELEADLSRRLVKRRGKAVKLTPKEYELLSYLIRHAGKALGHAELLHNVWGVEYGQESEYLRTFIWQLRHKIEDNPSDPRLILTEPGVGYRFTEPGPRQQ
jgi:DNA-binding winged helix-turn-helix (wHTH) protein